MELEQEFNNPSAKHRIKPFWFWNGDMTDEEIVYQIKEMAEKGLGGVFICARQGLKIPYLSQKWFDKVRFACDTAKAYGLEAWLYDEYPYPSGMSGGEVLLAHPEAEHTILNNKFLEVEGGEEVKVDLGWEEVLYAKAVYLDEEGNADRQQIINLMDDIGNLQETEIYQQTGLTAYNNKRYFTYGPKKILVCTLPKGRWRIEIYTQAPMGDFKYYGGFLDPCNKEAVNTFIQTTHEKYKKCLEDQLGESVLGMFSDEVSLLSPIPWTKLLPEVFYEKNGYSLIENLPALHDDQIKNAYKIRYDLYQTAHELFTESYHKQVANWCNDNKLMYATEVPSMRMSTQRYSDVIGGDTAHEKLGKPLEWIYDTYICNYRSNAKAVSSLARQLNKSYSMIESFHSVGWSMTIQDAKWMIDRLGASGINFYNFHAYYYTIDSITKHDAPPSQFIQNPYWKHYKLLGDYVGRMGTMISQTESVAEIAVFDPVASMWTHLGNSFHGFKYSGEDEKEGARCKQLVEDWVHVCKTILFNQMDYDHLDAEIMEETTIEDGRMKIGRASYSVIILPPLTCIESSVTKKLKEFIAAGGKVISIGLLPYHIIDQDQEVEKNYQDLMGVDIDTKLSYWGALEVMSTLYSKGNTYFIPTNGAAKQSEIEDILIPLCKELIEEKIEVQLEKEYQKDFITSVREDEEGNIFTLICNQGNADVVVNMYIKDSRYKLAEQYSLENGEIKGLSIKQQMVKLECCPYQSYLIKLSRLSEALEEQEQKTIIRLETKDSMNVAIDGGNIYRLDSFEMSIDKKSWRETEVKTFIEQCKDIQLLENNHIVFKGLFGTPKQIHINYPLRCYYRKHFFIEEAIENLSLLLDKGAILDEHTIYINNCPINKIEFNNIFVNDQNNMICNIDRYVRVGKNEIFIETCITKESDGVRDPIYLYGDFSVVGEDTQTKLVKQQKQAYLTSTIIKGFPYYSGTFTFSKMLDIDTVDISDKFILKFDFANTIYDCIEVKLNDKSLGVRAFTPYEWEGEREILMNGQNKIEIKITNTLANMLDGTYFDYKEHKLIKI